MDKDYEILNVVPRQAYETSYGTMQPYAITLKGVDGVVQLSQKPETAPPTVGQTIHGHTYEQQSKSGTFLKFKKVNPQFQGGGSSTGVSKASSMDLDYAIELLEAIAKVVGADSAVKGNKDLSILGEGEKVDLSDIPF